MSRCDLSELYAPRNIVKIKMIALSNDVVMVSDHVDTLYEVLRGVKDAQMLDYKILTPILQSLIRCHVGLKDGNAFELLVNKLLFDFLKWIEQYDFDAYTETALVSYAQLLVALLCAKDKIITDVDSTAIQWNDDTEYLIVTQLFKIVSKCSLESNKITQEIQKGNSKLAGVIIQTISKKDESKDMDPKAVQFVSSEADFNKQLDIHLPLTKQFNSEVYTEAVQSIELESFFDIFVPNEKTYPILTQLEQQPPLFWFIHTLPQIINWIHLIHTKFAGTLTEQNASTFMIKDVFKLCKLHKWGDPNEWRQQFEQFKDGMNAVGALQDDSSTKISITSCLASSMQNIQSIADVNNAFIAHHTIQMKHQHLWNVRSDHLVNVQHILHIMKQNIKPWICYDSHNELQPETYIIFDSVRIEKEIFNKCILGRQRLKIEYESFGFVGSRNMLKFIQSLRIKLEILNYETWHLFDKQFASNVQRKKK
eukprot:208809_1